MKKILLSMALVAMGSMSAMADDYTQVSSNDFEDAANLFNGDSRITVSVADDATLFSKVQMFKCAGNAQNGYSFAHYDFKSALYNIYDVVNSVKIELDYYNTNGGRAILSIGDADVRGTTGNSSKTTYSNKGAIFALGSNKTNSLLNGASKALADYTNKWMHLTVVVDADNKTYSYEITDVETEDVISSAEDVAFYSADADKCTQIDLFGYINNSTCAYLDNIVVSCTGSKAEKANFTVKYVCEGIDVKESETIEGIVGANPQLLASQKADFVSDGVKYIYVSDNTAETAITSDGAAVATVTYRKASIFNYSVESSTGQVLNTYTGFEGDVASYYFPYYLMVDGVTYKVSGNNYGQGSITLDADNKVATMNYNTIEGEYVYFQEAENIPSLTAYADGYTNIRMSNGGVGYAEQDATVITTLPAGKYILSSSSRAGSTEFAAAGKTILTLTSTGAVVDASSDEFTLFKDTEITVSAGSTSAYFDYVLVKKTGEADAAVVEALAALKAAIDEANELSATLEGATKGTLDEAIDVAQAVYDNSEDAEELETATTALKEAIKAAQSATAIKSVSVAKTNVVKFIENGQVKIVKNGKTVSVSGIAE